MPERGTPAPFGFTGELHSQGLVYLRARWYDGGKGTFTARDPSGLEPHLYQYARSNPVNFVDPSGLLCMGWMWGWATGDQQCTPVWYASQPGQSWLETTLADPASDLPDQAALFVVGLGHQGAYYTDEHFGTHGTETIARSPNLATNLGKATALAAEILSPLTRLGPTTGVTLGALNTSVSAKHLSECPSPENQVTFLFDLTLTLIASAGSAVPRIHASGGSVGSARVMTMQNVQALQVASGLVTVGTTVRSGALAWMASSGSGGGGSSSSIPSYTLGTKIQNQMGGRGWTNNLIRDTLQNPSRTVKTRDTRWLLSGRMNDPATAYIRSDGSYVVRNDITGDIVQISNRNDPNWISPWGP